MNGIKVESIQDEWAEVAYHLMKYITSEGRLSIVCAYHFRMLHLLRNLNYQKPHQRISIPHFILLSLKYMSIKVKKGKADIVAHHYLIKLIIYHEMKKKNPHVTWR